MIAIHAQVEGPIFSRHAKAIIEDAVQDTVRELVSEGEKMAKERAIEVVYSHGGAHPEQYRPTGRWLNSLHGEMTSPHEGTIDDSKLVYGPWLEGVSSRNDATRFKGYATFRHVFGQLELKADDVLERHIKRAIKRLD